MHNVSYTNYFFFFGFSGLSSTESGQEIRGREKGRHAANGPRLETEPKCVKNNSLPLQTEPHGAPLITFIPNFFVVYLNK